MQRRLSYLDKELMKLKRKFWFARRLIKLIASPTRAVISSKDDAYSKDAKSILPQDTGYFFTIEKIRQFCKISNGHDSDKV